MYDTELIVNVRWGDVEYSFIKYDLLFECYDFDSIVIGGILFEVDSKLFDFDNQHMTIFMEDMTFEDYESMMSFCEQLESNDWMLMEEDE